MNRLSAVVITFNEEESLARTLDSVAWCDEILVMDSGSSDRTLEIAASYPNCRIVSQPFLGYGPQKRKAVEAASYDWILSIDADEVLDHRMQAALKSWRESDPGGTAGYFVLRRLVFMGREFRYGRESRDRVLRLFDRRRGNFDPAPVHEKVSVEGKTGVLAGRLLHHSYRDLDEYFEKFNRYTATMARQMYDDGRRTSMPSVVFRPPVVFLQYYLLRCNWLNGFPGVVWSLLAAAYKTVKYLKLYELQTADRRAPAHRRRG